ncbi:lycopene cyclase family protein [Hymenobacter sp. DH14]|uniref:Lycopene cyclase family protein n=1 Tax=Hymenobacter cyanobacteriorum TaxID=2926463 RepID=A0A9X1VHS7_9BACT|nr:lycopene cyclase family protein [Hymenobacter cyanobacteriorum]MCI1188403.1 lycopene cyclase family protein [Hymenobacter cyanobacteriorum]
MSNATSLIEYDYLIVGGGAAGLSLAYHIAQEPRLALKKVLLIEPEAKTQNDRTWSFWSDAPGVFDGIVAHEWRKIAFRSPGFERVIDLGRYRYKTINGLAYYRFVHRALAARPEQFTVVRSAVESVENTPTGALAHLADGTAPTARYAFDSRPPNLAQLKQPEKHRYLLQHFVGWEIETEADVFDPTTVEFMDFRGEQQHEARFIYVLPFSARKALVEYTLFSEIVLSKAEYETAIRAYLTHTLGLKSYRITAEEVGAIPMTDHPLPARAGQHILNLGTRGGRAKPSTGYAFKRIQQHSARLVAALATTGQPPADATGDKWQFHLFDTLLLDIMKRRGESTRDIFRQLFERNPVERIFRFLDEQTSWADNLRIMNSVSAGPFMRSIAQVLRGRPGRREGS